MNYTECRIFSIISMTGFKHKYFLFESQKNICYFSVFFASLWYFADYEASVIALACQAGGSRGQVTLFFNDWASSRDQKMTFF